MRKSIISIIMILVILVTGCSTTTATTATATTATAPKTATETKKYKIPFFSEYAPVEYREYYKMGDFDLGQKANKEENDKVNKMCQDIVVYFNENYQANWKYNPIDCYITNVTEQMEKYDNGIGAMYVDREKKIFMDDSFVNAENKIQRDYVLSHELIHYLFESNNGHDFFLEKEGKKCGGYLEEAIVDMLSVRYTKHIHPDVSKEDLKSAYKYIRMFTDVLELSMPNYLTYFFKNDMEGLRREFNQLAEQHAYIKGDAFEKWIYLIDATYVCYVKGEVEYASTTCGYEISLLAVMTPKEKCDEFLTRVRNERSFDDEIEKYMY